VLDTTMHKTGRRQTRKITQNYMCWTQPYTRHRRRQTRQITQHYMMVVSNTYSVVLFVLLVALCVLCMVVSNTYSVVLFVLFVVVLSCVWLCPTHIVLCYLSCLSSSVSIHKTQRTTSKTNNTTLYVLDTTMHKTGRRKTRQITQHYMCWTQPYTRHRTTTNKTYGCVQQI
jgi:hypothetical protein